MVGLVAVLGAAAIGGQEAEKQSSRGGNGEGCHRY
jgi:hypothetical protein